MKSGGLSGGGQFGSLDAFSGALVPHIYFAEGEGCCGSTERFRVQTNFELSKMNKRSIKLTGFFSFGRSLKYHLYLLDTMYLYRAPLKGGP